MECDKFKIFDQSGDRNNSENKERYNVNAITKANDGDSNGDDNTSPHANSSA